MFALPRASRLLLIDIGVRLVPTCSSYSQTALEIALIRSGQSAAGTLLPYEESTKLALHLRPREESWIAGYELLESHVHPR